MRKLEVVHEVTLKEVITSVDLIDITGDGKDNLVISTVNGDIRIFNYVPEEDPPLEEICRTQDLPPVSSVALGDVIGNGVPDFILGGMDNKVRTVAYEDGKLEVKDAVQLGGLPTAICAMNVVGDKAAEVIVASDDGALRCYGWFDVALDKLAHKVIEKPIFSMKPLGTKGVPYSRFVFGDDIGNLYVYQYADDRLHERGRIKLQGEVLLVTTGSITKNRTDEILTVSDTQRLTLLSMGVEGIDVIDKVKAPGAVTSIQIGPIVNTEGEGQIITSQSNSKVTLLSYFNNRLTEVVSIKTVKKSVGSTVTYGNVLGDGKNLIIQAVGNNLFVVALSDE